MSVRTYPDVGRVFIPQVSISIPGRPAKRKPSNVVVATVRKPRWSIQEVFRLQEFKYATPKARATIRQMLEGYARQLDPMLFASEVIWASITHNDRVQDGGDHNVARIFGTVGLEAGVGANLALGDNSLTATNTHASIDTDTPGVTTNEHDASGLARVLATVQNYTAPASLDAVFDVDIYNSFSPTASLTVYGAALFDHITPASSHMLCEDLFSSSAVVENGDTLNVTYTYQN